jgi:hypothetical protein
MSSELGTSTLSPFAPPYPNPPESTPARQFHFGTQSSFGFLQAALYGPQGHQGHQFHAVNPQHQGNYNPTLEKTGQAFSQHLPQQNLHVPSSEQYLPLQYLQEQLQGQLACALYYDQQQSIARLQQQIMLMQKQSQQSEPFHQICYLSPSNPPSNAQANTAKNAPPKRSPKKSKGITPSRNPPSLQLNSNDHGLPPRHSPPLGITTSHLDNRSRSLDTRRSGSNVTVVRSLSPSYSLPDRSSNATDLSREFDDLYLVDAWMEGLIKTDGVFQENLAPTVTLPITCIAKTYEANTTKFSIENKKATMSIKHTAVQIKTTITNGKDHLAPVPQHYPESGNVTDIARKLFEALKIHPCRAQVLLNFLKRFPKNDLHNHLTGSIYLEEYINFAVEIGLFYDPIACAFHSDQRDTSITAKALRDHPECKEHFKKFRDVMSVHGCSKTATVTDGHKHFFDAFKTIESLTAHMPLDKQIVPVVKHARSQEVKYLELMIERLPSANLPDGFEDFFNKNTRFTDSGLQIDPEVMIFLKPWIDAYVQEQQKILDECNASVSRQLEISSITEIESPIVVKYLLEIMRDLPNHVFFARVAAAMALIQNYPHTVGLNVVGPEDDPLAVNNFQAHMKILGALHEINGRPNISLHAGEFSPVLASPNMRNHISDSILIGKAKRIGHGVALDFEELPGVLNLMKRNKVAVEVCLTSNKRILKVKSKDHPIKTYLKYGIPVIISTDDEAINRSSLTMELMRAIVKYNLSYEAIRKMAFDGVQHSFLPENTKQALIERIKVDIHKFETSISQTIKTVLDQQTHLQLVDQSATARTYKASTV